LIQKLTLRSQFFYAYTACTKPAAVSKLKKPPLNRRPERISPYFIRFGASPQRALSPLGETYPELAEVSKYRWAELAEAQNQTNQLPEYKSPLGESLPAPSPPALSRAEVPRYQSLGRLSLSKPKIDKISNIQSDKHENNYTHK
jgi:hypothetical protein